MSDEVFVVCRYEDKDAECPTPAFAFVSAELAEAYDALPGNNYESTVCVPIRETLPTHFVQYRLLQWLPKESVPFEAYWPRNTAFYARAKWQAEAIFLEQAPDATPEAAVTVDDNGRNVLVIAQGADKAEVRRLFKKALAEQRRRLGTEDYHERAMAAMPADYDPEAAIREEMKARLNQ